MSRLALGMHMMARSGSGSSGWQTIAPRVTMLLGVPISSEMSSYSCRSMRQYSATSSKGAQASKSTAVRKARKSTSKKDKAGVASAADSAPAKKREAKASAAAAAAAKQTTKATTTRPSAVANDRQPEAVDATASRPATTPAAPTTPPNPSKAHPPIRSTMPTPRPYVPTPPPRPSPASQSKEPKKPISIDSPEYKQAEWKWVSTIVALPIFLVTSYVLYDRLVVGFLINRDTINTPAERLQRLREKIATQEKGPA